MSTEDYEFDASSLPDNIREMADIIGEELYSADEPPYQNAEDEIRFIFEKKVVRALKLMGYDIDKNASDILTEATETLALTLMKSVIKIDDVRLKTYVFEGNDRALLLPFQAIDILGEEEMTREEHTANIAQQLEALEACTKKIADTLGIERKMDILHPAVQESRTCETTMRH